MPVARLAISDGEKAHSAMITLCKWGLVPKYQCANDRLQTRVFGLDFCSPLGLAAGFDKHGDAIKGVYRMGFSHSEIGSVTPQPQPGNPKPRVFRLVEDQAIINRYGFPSVGHARAHENIQKGIRYKTGPLGINLGANKTSANVVQDFVDGVNAFADLADYFVVNVSSPNTPGLRVHQKREKLLELLTAVLKARDALQRKIPLLLKIAPDLTKEDKESIAQTALELNVDGLIVCNTTISRPETLKSIHKNEAGGLSGDPEKDVAMETLRDMFELTKGRIPIIALGGISSGEEAYRRIRAGASLIQVYTAFTYQGPPLVKRINDELEAFLKRDGLRNIADAVGIDRLGPSPSGYGDRLITLEEQIAASNV
ncbi:dihydroorotate dehydrogenase (quinone), mitochondrial-like isoform X2 [Paramacrobiotus metropolitanus]|nr:dihydroorotate dehydrogenase (quinone), mitochondrial-like isoform X2 [Paramacrobiotus metropolitanus]